MIIVVMLTMEHTDLSFKIAGPSLCLYFLQMQGEKKKEEEEEMEVGDQNKTK